MKSKNPGGINKLALFAGSITVFTFASLLNIGMKEQEGYVLGEATDSSCESSCNTSSKKEFDVCVSRMNLNQKMAKDRTSVRKEFMFQVTGTNYEAGKEKTLSADDKKEVDRLTNEYFKNTEKLSETKKREEFCKINSVKSAYSTCVASCKKAQVSPTKSPRVTPKAEKKIVNRVRQFFSRNAQSKWE